MDDVLPETTELSALKSSWLALVAMLAPLEDMRLVWPFTVVVRVSRASWFAFEAMLVVLVDTDDAKEVNSDCWAFVAMADVLAAMDCVWTDTVPCNVFTSAWLAFPSMAVV